jgi:transketolase
MSENKKKWITHAFTDELINLARKNKKIILLDADLADDVNLYKFKKTYPNRFIQNGIAEQDMVSMAGGISLVGLLPIVNSFASFLTARANEQIFNNASEKTKIIYMSLYAGLLPAGAGKSHQSTRDISLMSNIPNMKIYHPYDFVEAKQILRHCINKEKNNCSIRLSIGPPYPNQISLGSRYKFKDGSGNIMVKGKKNMIIAYGQLMLKQAINVSNFFKKKSIYIQVVNLSTLNSFNFTWVNKILKNKSKIFLFDEHYKSGGFADLFLSFVNDHGLTKNKTFKKVAIGDFPSCGTPEEVLKKHKLDEESLIKIISRLI